VGVSLWPILMQKVTLLMPAYEKKKEQRKKKKIK